MDPKLKRQKPKLDRRNAVKNIVYDAASTSSSSFQDPSSLVTRSLDLCPNSDRTSFRIKGIDGEFDIICRSLGLSGPDDFAIPAAAWEARKIRSSSDLLPRSRLNLADRPEPDEPEEITARVRRFSDQDRHEIPWNSILLGSSSDDGPGGIKPRNTILVESSSDGRRGIKPQPRNSILVGSSSDGVGGIKGVRPPVLAPPPSMLLPVLDNLGSTWDILESFAPPDEYDRGSSSSNGGLVMVDGAISVREEANVVRLGETVVLFKSCSFSTSNEDDSPSSATELMSNISSTSNEDDFPSSTTEPMSNISPDGSFRRNIYSWQKGDRLGSGSFGTVYEGITDDGFFFAVKEVSLLDQGSQGRQSIYQLEQEISLLSQFEHENIVQYIGTDKDESKLYIFLELVTKGSLLNLYQKYHLQDSQVSAYTRQILNGLKYLHDRNVVHRDIKCANILVHASGSVKLADFGLAKATTLNDVKSCKGTAFWMAPEVVNRKNHGYGLPADIWSLGCTVLEMLTRQLPYSHLECMQAIFRIGKGEQPPIPNSLSIDARDFILQCLQVNPDDRPTAAQLLNHQFVKKPLSTSSGFVSPHINGRRSYNFLINFGDRR
ncbi:hypothetical protein HHK36_009053 [Tetracentron sinense]|uniref:mitogen-activated protein kinase kinase kinase n=1 Tax=Tetracentron sinense TaxID=13715 RepID=A0A835DI00_TETSI|nr:hypothetical protein HHK36_009053 [Tetracentron sinense]